MDQIYNSNEAHKIFGRREVTLYDAGVVCAQQDGNFHVFPPDDSSPMSTSLPLAGKVFSSYFADYILSAAVAAAAEI